MVITVVKKKPGDMQEKLGEGWNFQLARGRPEYNKEPVMEDEG